MKSQLTIPNKSLDELKGIDWQEIYVVFKSGAEIKMRDVNFNYWQQ